MKKTIGQSLGFGFAGNYSQQPDLIISTEILKGEKPVYFGQAVYMNEDGFVHAVDADFTSDNFVGIASSEVRSAITVDNMDGVYRKDNPASIMTRGVISVICQKGTPKRAGVVYVRIANETADLKIGGFEAEADGADTVALKNCVWSSVTDSNKIADVRLKNINLV